MILISLSPFAFQFRIAFLVTALEDTIGERICIVQFADRYILVSISLQHFAIHYTIALPVTALEITSGSVPSLCSSQTSRYSGCHLTSTVALLNPTLAYRHACNLASPDVERTLLF